VSAVAQAVSCPVCTRALPPDTWNLDYETYCPTCRTPVSALVFPAFLRESGGSAAELAVEGSEAACFYHARKKAVVPCDRCGRFLCTLCQVELSGENWCPSCIALHRKQGKLAGLDNRRMLYDNIALLLAVGPVAVVVFSLFTLFTAPATLFVVFRYWRAPSSLVPRTKVRFVIAGVFALMQLAGWGFIIFSVILGVRGMVR
jgi:AhpD family alkylhydroperoxidase